MKLIELKNQFKLALNKAYTTNEIEQIFYAVAENILDKEKKILRLALNENWSDFDDKKHFFYHHLNELQKGKPLQYVLKEAYFYGIPFFVDENVLIPRPETEELVEWLLHDFKNTNNPINLLDAATGSGCIAITIKKEKSNWGVSGFDVSEEALKIAKENNFALSTKVNFFNFNLLESDFNELDGYDIIVSNPPYIKMSEADLMNKNTLNYEPHLALFVENSEPLIFYKKLIELSQLKLKKNGFLYVEINQFLAKETELLFKRFFNHVELRKDISNNYRMIKAGNL